MDDAFCELMAALLIDPARRAGHAAIGQLYLDAGRDEEAVRAFNRALELKPDAIEASTRLATALTRLGKTERPARQLELFERAAASAQSSAAATSPATSSSRKRRRDRRQGAGR